MARKRRGRAHNAIEQTPQAPPPPPVPPPANAANSEAPSGSSGPPRAARKSAPVTPKPTSASKAAPSSPKPVDEPARPRPDPPKPKSAPVQAEAPSLPKSAIRDALQALETGCVPEAYETLSRALFGSDDAEPQEEEEVVHKLNEIALLICRARSTMEEDGDAQLVVNDLDKAQTLWTKFGAESNPPKKLETPVKLHHVRLWAFAALDDYKKVLEEAEIITEKADRITPATSSARMTAFFHLGRLAEAAQAARIYLSFPDPLASQKLAADILQAAEEKKRGDEAYKKGGQWERAMRLETIDRVAVLQPGHGPPQAESRA